jgi:hypothetical protein
LTTSSATSPQAPDFSGTWSAVKDAPNGVAAAPSPIFGARFAIRHEGAGVTFLRPIRDEHIAVTFKPDGSRVNYKVPGRMCEGDAEYIETLAVEDGGLALTFVGAVPPGGGPARELNSKRLFRLEDKDTLVVQGTMVQQGKSWPAATVYKRADPMPVPAQKPSGAPGTIAQLGWLAGDWAGTRGGSATAAPLNFEERWAAAASGSMLALSRTVRGTTLVSFEFLCIAERNNTLVYTAMPDGRTTPTHFTLTSITADTAIFENPAHDFPKAVRYVLKPDGSMEASIGRSATEFTTTFAYKKRQ